MSSAKLLQTSRDGITWNTLAGNDGSIEANGTELDNTTFGSDFSSSLTGIIEHSLSGNVMFRDNAGFEARLKRAENSTAFTAEELSLVGNLYVIDDRTKALWNPKEALVISDTEGAIASTDIASVDYMNGRVKFVDSFTPVGAVTATGEFLTAVNFACANSVDISQTLETIETGCFETVGENGGFQTYEGTLRSVSIDIDRFYRSSTDFYEILKDRDDIIIEFDMDGTGTSVARGQFKVLSDSLTGGVGGDESESITFNLSVPTTEIPVVPFSWYFGANTNAPMSFQDMIWAWEGKQPLKVRYLPEGQGNLGFQGDYIITDASVSVAVDSIGEGSISGQGTGALVRINAA